MPELYDRIIDEDLTVRRVTLVACNLITEGEIPADAPEQLDLFTDYADEGANQIQPYIKPREMPPLYPRLRGLVHVAPHSRRYHPSQRPIIILQTINGQNELALWAGAQSIFKPHLAIIRLTNLTESEKNWVFR